MPRHARCVEPGFAYHITQRGANRERVFLSVEDRRCYLELLRCNLRNCETRILAFCYATL